MPRCNSCNKFVAINEDDAEVVSLDVDDTGTVTASVHIVNSCMDCGEELTEATFEVDDTVDDLPDTCEHELEVEEVECIRTQPDLNPLQKNGKPIPLRYRKTFYGFELECDVQCRKCKFNTTVVLADSIQASHMDSLN